MSNSHLSELRLYVDSTGSDSICPKLKYTSNKFSGSHRFAHTLLHLRDAYSESHTSFKPTCSTPKHFTSSLSLNYHMQSYILLRKEIYKNSWYRKKHIAKDHTQRTKTKSDTHNPQNNSQRFSGKSLGWVSVHITNCWFTTLLVRTMLFLFINHINAYSI